MNFWKIPKGRRSFSIQKNYIADFGPLNRSFEYEIEEKKNAVGFSENVSNALMLELWLSCQKRIEGQGSL